MDQAAPSFNPLKRGAGSSGLPDPPESADPAIQISGDVRHVKSLSGGPFLGQDPDFRRGKPTADEVLIRTIATKPKLFDPDRDDPSARNSSRKGKSQGHVNVGHRHNASLRDSNFRAKRPVSSDLGDGKQLRPPQEDFATAGHKTWQPNPATILKPPRSTAAPDSRNDFPEQDTVANETQDDPEPDTEMLRQPETRPISHDQLVVEVKGIYAGLVMVEAKCIDVDEKQTIRAQEDASKREPLKNDQWQSLIALHKQLLHEHHDFFLASQHPSASSNLSKLAAKYSMPARMWRHGIHAFLEVLRHRLPESLEHMLAFIYIAYSMMALLYETVSTFEDTWIECLGDLGRYRMAIEDDEPKDREVWSGVARFWYSKAADKNPSVGRLYHHLAILARPYTLEQLSFYTRSLTCVTPFESARGSIMTLFNPILDGRETGYHRSSSMEPLTIKAHSLLFLYPKRPLEELDDVFNQLKDGHLVDEFVERNGPRFKRNGVFLAVSNIAALFEFGALTSEGKHRSMLRRAFDQHSIRRSESASGSQPSITDSTGAHNIKIEQQTEQPPVQLSLTAEDMDLSKIVVSYASDLTFSMFEIVLAESNWERNHILPMVHVKLVFIWCISSIPEAMQPLEKDMPWTAICSYLNYLAAQSGALTDKIWDTTFPDAQGTTGRPPPEDYIIRGQVYTQRFFPPTWFSDAKVDDEERMLEQSSHDSYRNIRVLWLAARICSTKQWICFDQDSQKFMTTDYANDKLARVTVEESDIFPKTEIVDKDEVMVKAPTPVSTKVDSEMPDVSAEETFAKEEMVSRNAREPVKSLDASTTTTRTNTDMTDATSLPEGPTTPRAIEFEEPEEPPEDAYMVDLSPGRENMSIASSPPIKIGESPWTTKLLADPGSSPPKKAPSGDRVRILNEDLSDNEL